MSWGAVRSWTIPGGVMEANGETPWQAGRREVAKECGIDVPSGTLACVDFRPPRPGKPGGIRFLFDCGTLSDHRPKQGMREADTVAGHLQDARRIGRVQPIPSGRPGCLITRSR